MALSGQFMRRILGGGRSIVSLSTECRNSCMRLKSTLSSPRLFITGVPALITDKKIKEAFAPFGNLVEAKVIRDGVSGRSKGFAIVTYETIEEAEKALKRRSNTRLGGYVVAVEPRDFEPSDLEHACPDTSCSVCFYLDDVAESEVLSSLRTVDKLKEAFAPFGNIVEARIDRDRFRMSKGFATVRYDTREEAERARKAMDDNCLGCHAVVPVKPKAFTPSAQEQTPSDTSYTTNMTSGYIQSSHYHTEAEAKGGKYTNKVEVKKQSIKKGDIISLKDLLFTRNRDYLVKNNGERVKAEQLEGKVIVIYFLPLYVYCPQYAVYYTSLLKEVHHDLLPNNNFEVVLVANNYPRTSYNGTIVAHPSHLKDPGKHFEDLFSSMPWTAIPYSDVVSRESMQRSFGVGTHKEYGPLTVFVVDSTGMVLQCDDWDVFQDFGAAGYPFSDQRLEFMRAEDDAAAKQPSLKTLLASPERDYVFSNKGDQVPIYTLEDKVVALYFYHANAANHDLTEKLMYAYKMLAASNRKFEVVLVYITELGPYGSISDSEKSFWKDFKTMPWLALPFRDDRSKKLRRVFKFSDYDEDDLNEVVIIGPHGEFVEPFGANILLQYDISAYPFTCNKVVELEIEKIKELKLEMIWDKNTVFRRNNGSWVPFSELSGKRIMLVFERIGGVVIGGVVRDDLCQGSQNAKFLMMLKGRYLQLKGTADEFEVIRILANNMGYLANEPLDLGDSSCLSSLARDLGDMHWIVCLASELMQNLYSSCFWYDLPIHRFGVYLPILAFDRDGRLVRKSIFPSFEDMKFPFCARGLEEDMLSEFTRLIE